MPDSSCPDLGPGWYVEASPEGYSLWFVDEDGDWSEAPPRGEIEGDTPRAYYRVSDYAAWQLLPGEATHA